VRTWSHLAGLDRVIPAPRRSEAEVPDPPAVGGDQLVAASQHSAAGYGRGERCRENRAELVSLPCCIHLAATDDFLAVLPKRDRLEIRFTLHRRLDSPRIRACSQTSRTSYKHSIDVSQVEDIDAELLGWLREAYRLRAG
jgi:hypothetical protein